MHGPPDEALLRSPLPRSLGEGTSASPRLVVDIWLAVPVLGGPAPGGSVPDGPPQDTWQVLLLLRRPEQGGFWQGVSGRVETTDACLEAAALREIQEETGYVAEVRVFDLGRWLEFTSPLSGKRFRKRSLGATLPSHAGPRTVRLSEEHSESRLVSFAQAHGLVRFASSRDELTALEARVRAPQGRA
jgi:8-oxo-dGTP pyrophosphatase MutT (NUDIX family)